MAITVDYSVTPFLITIPQSDLTLITGTQYQLTVDTFWLLLRDFTDNENAVPQPKLYRRTPATASTPSITEIEEAYYALQFENGAYSVNIINGNTNIREVEVKNTVSVNTNNTTGFINPEFLELGLFNGAVCIDSANASGAAVSGTGKTANGLVIGTRQAPCLAASDALVIAQGRGINKFNLMSDLTLTGGNYSAGYSWTADRLSITLTVQAAANVTGNAMDTITVSGELDGLNRLANCEIDAVTNVSGELFQCNLESTMSINGDVHIISCYSGVAGGGHPMIQTIGTNEVIIRDFHGSIGLHGMTGGTHSIGLEGGKLTVGADSTAGTIHARNMPFEIENLGTATVVVETSDLATWANSKALTFQKWLGLR